MKATGVVRRIDDLGRVVIPKEIRKKLDWQEEDALGFYLDENNNLVLKKYIPEEHKDAFFTGICPVAIDVGINRDENNKICGDIDRELYPYFKRVTSVPGGVGVVTTLTVVSNIIKLYENKHKKEVI